MAYSDKQKFKPTNINYTSKDFSTIKADLIEYTKSYFPNTYKDFNETSPGMMLIELSSYVGDVLSYYVDYNYKENVLSTATEKRNVRRLAEFLGYKTPNKTPSVVKLKVTTDIGYDDVSARPPDFNSVPNQISPGLQIQSNIDSTLLFETTGVIDFSISGSTLDEPPISAPIIGTDGLTTGYTLTRYVQAISAETKTKSFTITSPTKFLELDLGEDNVIEILNCTDSSGEKWYEVDYLSQERILKETYYNDADSTRGTGYDQGEGITGNSLIPIPYTLDYINTNKKFVTNFDVDTNSTKLMFGNGLYKYNVTGSSNSSIFTTIEQVGLTLNGDTFSSINAPTNTLFGTNNLNMGETPTNTILTVKYRVGGGPDSNAQVGELTTIADGTTGITVTNDEPATGGTDGQTVEEIRHNAKAFFSSQNRCVTRQDYQARILNLPAKFGNIAKCYVERLDDTGGLFVSTLSYNQNKQLVQTPELVLSNIMTYLNQYKMINDQLDFGFQLEGSGDTLFSGYLINFGVKFEVNADRRVNPTDVKIEVINTIRDFFKVERMQFRQSINMNDLQYHILGLEGVIGIKELKLFQVDASRNMTSYQADGDGTGGESGYGFQYEFDGAEENGIIRPSLTPAVFELRNPNQDIYGKVT
jgi:hypothetical protein